MITYTLLVWLSGFFGGVATLWLLAGCRLNAERRQLLDGDNTERDERAFGPPGEAPNGAREARALPIPLSTLNPKIFLTRKDTNT